MTEIPTFPPQPPRRLPIPALITIAVISGMFGTALSLWLFPDLRRAVIPPGTQSVIVQSPGTVVVEEGVRVTDLARQTEAVSGSLFVPAAAIHMGITTIYPAESATGSAVMLTTDGWFATVRDAALTTESILVVAGQSFSVEKVVADPASPYVLGKVDNSGFASIRFLETKGRQLGMTIVANDVGREVARLTLSGDNGALTATSLYRSSDTLGNGFTVTPGTSFTAGTPIFSLHGSLVGLTTTGFDERTVVLPSEVLETFLEQTLRFGEPTRASLGVRYVLTEAANGDVRAVLAGNRAVAAITPGLPAAGSVLRAGDSIVSLNGTKLDDSASFGLVYRFIAGESVVVGFERSGEVMEEIVVLSELST